MAMPAQPGLAFHSVKPGEANRIFLPRLGRNPGGPPALACHVNARMRLLLLRRRADRWRVRVSYRRDQADCVAATYAIGDIRASLYLT